MNRSRTMLLAAVALAVGSVVAWRVARFSKTVALTPAPVVVAAATPPASNPIIAPRGVADTKGKSKRSHTPAPTIDPISEISKINEQDASLGDWLSSWDKNWGKLDSETDSKDALALILKNTPVESDLLFDVARGFRRKYKDDKGSFLFYQAAAVAAHRALSSKDATAAQRLLIIQKMATCREDFKDVLWPLIEDNRNPVAIATLSSLYSDAVAYTPADNKKLLSVRSAELVGYAECLYLQDKNDEALEVIGEASGQSLSASRDISLEWISALVLLKKGEKSEAIDHLKNVISSPKSKFHDEATYLLVKDLCELNRRDDAQNVINDYETENVGKAANQNILSSLKSCLIQPANVAKLQ